MIYSSKILNTNNKSIIINPKINENDSLFIESLKYLLEDNKIFSTQFNSSILNESIRIKNPLEIIIDILKAFLKLIERIWEKFVEFCKSLVSKTSVIKEFTPEIQKINYPIDYSNGRYIYTNLKDDVSYTSFKLEMMNIYTTLKNKLENVKNLSSSEILIKMGEFKEDSNIDEIFFDEVRGKTIGKDSCSKDDYAKELFKFFRSGSSTLIEDEPIMPTELHARLTSWNNYDKTLKTVKKYKSDINTCSKNIQDNIKSIKLSSYISSTANDEIYSIFSDIINNYIIKVKNICDIYVYYFSTRLDAIKEEYSMNSKILFKAINTIKN